VPELPEVETTLRGIAPHVVGHRIARVVVRDRRLRWPVPADLEAKAAGRIVKAAARRAKYLLLDCGGGTLIVHLGMSGSLRVVPAASPPGAHDHADIVLEAGHALRLNDPRRFGCLLWTAADPLRHPLLRDLGPEPLGTDFGGDYLHGRARGRHVPVKHFLMDSHTVAGLGNIYVNEALFAAGIHPARAAGRISAARYARLAEAIRTVLTAAIGEGGTTLRDFVGGDGRPGYFQLRLSVYGRAGQPCPACGAPVRAVALGQRASYACRRCQT
jgi:formamidopyrimidine-DNA glycosylase